METFLPLSWQQFSPQKFYPFWIVLSNNLLFGEIERTNDKEKSWQIQGQYSFNKTSKACTTFTMYEQNLFHHLCQDGLHRSYTSVPSSKSLTCLWSNPYSLSAFNINDKEEKIFSSLITGPLLYDNTFCSHFSKICFLRFHSLSTSPLAIWIFAFEFRSCTHFQSTWM